MAAGTFYWRGTQSPAWNDGRNWVDDTGAAYAAGRYPGSSPGDWDTVYYDSALSTGAHSTDGFDGSLLEDMNSVGIGPDYDGTIGSASAPLIIPSTNTIVRVCARTSPGVFLSTSGRGADIYVHDAILLDLKGEWTAAKLFRGTVTFSAGARISSLIVSYTSSQASDVKLTIADTVTLPPADNPCVANGGTVVCNTPVGQLYMTGGSWTGRADLTTLWMYGACTYTWESGDIGTVDIYQGVLDGSRSSKTRTYGDIRVYPAGALNINNYLGNITGDTISNYGGSVIRTPGT